MRSVENLDISIQYDEENHLLFIYTPDDKQFSDQIELESYLRSKGIYARIEKFEKSSPIRTSLKPASSVEFRDENGNLINQIVRNPLSEKGFKQVRSTNNQNSFNFQEIQTDKSCGHYQIEFLIDKYLCFKLVNNKDGSVKIKDRHVNSIPSVIGNSVELGGHGIKYNDELDYFETTKRITGINIEYNSEIKRNSITEYNVGGSTYYRINYPTQIINKLDISENTELYLKLARKDDTYCILLCKSGFHPYSPSISVCKNTANSQHYSSFPKPLIHAIGLNSGEVNWRTNANQEIILY